MVQASDLGLSDCSVVDGEDIDHLGVEGDHAAEERNSCEEW